MSSDTFVMPGPAEINHRPYDNANIPHQYVCTPQWNFGVNAGARVLNDIFNDGLTSDIVWQPDTYHAARKYADEIGAKRVIDIGCGSALKLKSLFSDGDLDVIAVDFAGSLVAAKENYPNATHVECDLTSWNEVLAVADRYRDGTPTVVICADVIEHISDPRPLLAFIRTLLTGSGKSRCFLSTPDRSRLGYASLTNKPANPAHIREWTNGELRNLLMSSGFNVVQIGNIRANVYDERNSTILAECSFDKKSYQRSLTRAGIAASDAILSIMLTTEYPGLINSGGIGTFVADWHRSTQNSAILTSFDFDTNEKSPRDSIISPSNLLDQSMMDDVGIPDILLQSVTQLLFLCPEIKEIHYQEYLGIGFRIAQAKRSGILPDSISIIAHCHGNQHYLENANQTWFGEEAQVYAVKEKISIELADSVVFPSNYLWNLYSQSGIQINADTTLVCPYQYTNIIPEIGPYGNVKRLVFVGKFMPMKGFDLFCAALDESFCKELKAKGIEEISLIGRGRDTGFENERVIKRRFKLSVHTNFDQSKLINFIRENRSDSLFVEPYRGDNFPLAVFDVVGNGGVLLAGNAGGIPEMFRTNTWRECLADLTVDTLRYKIRELIDWDNGKKYRIASELIDDLGEINRIASSVKHSEPRKTDGKLLSSTVMIPFYNTDISEFVDLLKALNQQSLRPSEVIIVNDASNYKSRQELEEAAEKYLEIPYKIIDHAVNCGLAGARNTALSACKTDLILNADSDDIPLNDWVKSIVVALSRDPMAAAAVPYLGAFDAGSDYNRYVAKGQYTYRPLGDGFVTSQTHNDLGHANSGYRVSVARGMGGWNASSKAKYEDWAFYLNVLANGLRIAIIPTVTCLYRVRKNSMARTYAEWPGQVRLYQTTNGLSRFETLQLQRLSRATSGAGGIVEIQKRLHALENRKILRITDAIVFRLRRVPIVYSALRFIARLTWSLAIRFRRGLRS
ncbi:glycosyltransferase [Phyllobacterium phragmitis]|uniref:Glycosyltransferase 2-like domain-containing protein n=1 Tax=Phyllobacterium phragmitis TaxID=2670329 RepID=A0ABQ0GXF0_9HYPH